MSRLESGQSDILKASPTQIAQMIVRESDSHVVLMNLRTEEAIEEFILASDALNYHRVELRLNEEGLLVIHGIMDRVKSSLCVLRQYELEEFDAALDATKQRVRLPFGWSALDLAQRRLYEKPIRLLDPALESSRYMRGVVGLAVYLQEIQRNEPILLPVEQVREALSAKKIVISGTINKLVELGLLEVTKATYHTGSAREFMFRGKLGKDYEFLESLP